RWAWVITLCGHLLDGRSQAGFRPVEAVPQIVDGLAVSHAAEHLLALLRLEGAQGLPQRLSDTDGQAVLLLGDEPELVGTPQGLDMLVGELLLGSGRVGVGDDETEGLLRLAFHDEALAHHLNGITGVEVDVIDIIGIVLLLGGKVAMVVHPPTLRRTTESPSNLRPSRKVSSP